MKKKCDTNDAEIKCKKTTSGIHKNNEDKISKGGPVKKSSTKATRGRGRSRKNSSVKK